MKKNHFAKLLFLVTGGIFVIFITVMALIPFLNDILSIEVVNSVTPSITISPISVQYKKEEPLITVLYGQEEISGEISAIYLEVFQPGKKVVYYMEIPVQTKIKLSDELYKKLQTYSPELPQYLKLSKMAQGFSKEYALTGCNRILSELLGISLEHYVGTNPEDLQDWFTLLKSEHTKEEFFEQYNTWIGISTSDLSFKERWVYYESYQQVIGIEIEKAIGSQEAEEFMISSKQCNLLLEQWKELLRAKK